MKAIIKQMSILLSVMMIIGMFTVVPVGASAAVTYVDRTWDADEKKIVETSTTTTDYTSLSSSITELRSGKYVLDSDVTYSKSLKVKSGASAELILVNGKTLKNDKGIIVPQNATLTIYGQAASGDVKADSGIVDAYNPDGAAIGAMDEEKTGSIIIKGGTVKATGGTKDAGIGTGKNHSSGFEEIAIYGGNVTAQGGKCGAGIGAGRANSSEKGKKINIYGGTIKATGGDFGAGIGGGEDSSVDVINIYGCEKITATGGKEAAGIGSGNEENNHGTINIFGGKEITAKGGKLGAGIGGGDDGNSGTINISGGKVTSRGGENAAGIGGGEDSHGENITISGGEVNACSRDGAGIGGGEDGKQGDIKITGGTVRCISERGAGIGGGNEEHTRGSITIDGGVVFSVSEKGAGIGSGYWSDMESPITINGGQVYARSGVDYDVSFSDLTVAKILFAESFWGASGAGIGAGSAGSQDGTITINDGTVIALGGGAGPTIGFGGGAGIGGGTEYGSDDGLWSDISDIASDIMGGITGFFGVNSEDKPDNGTGGEGGPVIINGGIVVAWGDSDASAIGYGEDGSSLSDEDLTIPLDYAVYNLDLDISVSDVLDLISGKKTFSDIYNQLKDSFKIIDRDKRVKQCQKEGQLVALAPCLHTKKLYTLFEGDPTRHHLVDCKNCNVYHGKWDRQEVHEGSPCEKCGYDGVYFTVSLDYGNEIHTHYVPAHSEFVLPQAPDAIINGEHKTSDGWIGPDNKLYEAGYTFNVDSDGTKYTVNYISSYQITVEDLAHGKLSAGRNTALSGETITVEYQPDEGYKAESITVNGVALQPDENGRYTFVMPHENVTISGAFVPSDHYHIDAETEEVLTGFTYYTTPNGSITSNASYYLADDEQTMSSIAGRVTVDLCLKGHTLSIPNNLTVAAGATLNIYDCSGEGKITGGSIFVLDGSTVNFYGGSIKGNTTASGVIIADGGTVNMYAGSIEENTYEGGFSGVIVSAGASFNILGDVTIRNNYIISDDTTVERNVYLDEGAKITIGAELSELTRIGVTTAAGVQMPYVFTDGLNGKGSAACFLSDKDGLFVEQSSNGEAQLNEPYKLSFDANGGSGTMEPDHMTESDYYLPGCDFTAPSGKRFYGWKIGDKVYMESARVTITEDTTAYAQWTSKLYNIWLDGQRVTEENKSDIIGNGTAAYNPATNTLTLTNAHIEMSEYKSGLSAGIRYNEGSNHAFNIVLNGTNTIKDEITDRNIDEKYGIIQFGAAASYTISGPGTLDIEMTADEEDVAYYGIHTRKALTVDSARVSVDIPGTEKTTGVDLMYTYSYLKLQNGAQMTIDTGSDDRSYALASDSASTLAGSHLYVEDTGTAFSAGSGNRAFNENITLSNDTKSRGASVNTENTADSAAAWDKESALSSYRYIYIPGKQYFVGHSITLNGDIGVNFFLALSDEELAQGVRADFAWNGKSSPVTFNSESEAETKTGVEGLYKATCYVCAAEMNDEITASITVGDASEPVATETYKVKDYADVIIANKDGKFSDKLITLVKTMLNYGAKAQIQFEHNTDALANAGIDYELVSLSENEISGIAGAVPDKNHINALLTESKIEYYGYSLILKTKTTLRFYFKKNGANTSQLELVNDAGVNVGTVHDYNADYCYIEISDIASAMLSECYTLQYGVVTLGSFSALSYVKDVLQSNGGKQPITDTVTALYRYQEAAVAYFDNNQEGGQ